MLHLCSAGPLWTIQARIRTTLKEVVDVHLCRDNPPEPGEVQHGRPTDHRAGGHREAGVKPPKVHTSAKLDGHQCSGGTTTSPQPHCRADDVGEGVELVDSHRRPRLHHAEDGERSFLQGLALVIHLDEAALQVCHLTVDGVQLLLQPYE